MYGGPGGQNSTALQKSVFSVMLLSFVKCCVFFSVVFCVMLLCFVII